MKIPQDESKGLTAFNLDQVKTVRAESDAVKTCYTTQAHQTLMLCTALTGVGAGLFATSNTANFHWSLLVFSAGVASILCLSTIHIGCHKYATSNRALGYEIHLARAVEYGEASNQPTAQVISRELRRIDWEQAMFAWRMVQPVIFDYFYYVRQRWGISLRRFQWGRLHRGIDPTVVGRMQKYPWYDTNEMLASSETLAVASQAGASAEQLQHITFHPGSYLSKSVSFLSCVMILCACYVLYGEWHIWLSHRSTLIRVLVVVSAVSYVWCVVTRWLDRYWRFRLLESGLLSIQTSAFIWRIICISHLCAVKLAAAKNATGEGHPAGRHPQIYGHYTSQLSAVAAHLRCHLHDVHDWLMSAEEFISEPDSKFMALRAEAKALGRVDRRLCLMDAVIALCQEGFGKLAGRMKGMANEWFGFPEVARPEASFMQSNSAGGESAEGGN